MSNYDTSRGIWTLDAVTTPASTDRFAGQQASSGNVLRMSRDQANTLSSYTTTQMNALTGMQAGTMIYNSDEAEPFFYNGSDWRSVIDGNAE